MPAANSFVVLATRNLTQKERLALARWETVIRSRRALDLYRLLRARFGDEPGTAATTALAAELLVSADTVLSSFTLLEEQSFVRRSGSGFFKCWEVLPVPQPPRSRPANYRGHREGVEGERERHATAVFLARLPVGAATLLGEEPAPDSSELRLRAASRIVGPPWEAHTRGWIEAVRAATLGA